MKHAHNFKDLTNIEINNLKFIKFLYRSKTARSSYWEVRCYCGNVFKCIPRDIIKGKTKSCGCLVYDQDKNPHYKGGIRNLGSIAWANTILRSSKIRAKKYGYKELILTAQELSDIYKQHNHCCDLCGIPEQTYGKSLCIDHDHITGKYRGFLCIPCNSALARLGDNIENIYKVFAYLSKS